MLKLEAGVGHSARPFQGGGEQNSALLGGHIDLNSRPQTHRSLFFSPEYEGFGHLEKIKQFPGVPTLAEKGYPKAAFTNWVGCFGPKGMESRW